MTIGGIVRIVMPQVAVAVGSTVYGGRASTNAVALTIGALGAFLSSRATCGAREPREAMTLELRILALSVVLGLVQIVLASHAASLQRGYRWTAGSRDQAVPRLTGMAGRLERALRNFVETFPLFAAAVLIAHVTNTHSWMTEWGVQLYFGARVAYLALYAAGVFLLRSLVWNVATLGIALVLLSLV